MKTSTKTQLKSAAKIFRQAETLKRRLEGEYRRVEDRWDAVSAKADVRRQAIERVTDSKKATERALKTDQKLRALVAEEAALEKHMDALESVLDIID